MNTTVVIGSDHAGFPMKGPVMELLRDGATDLSVTEAGQPIGAIRATDVMSRLLDPRGA